MKELLRNPFILISVLAIGIIYLAIAFHCIGRNKKIAAIFETVVTGICVMAICKVVIVPFNKLTPEILAGRETTMPTYLANIGLYGIALFLLSSRLRYNLKNFGDVFLVLLTRAPFFSCFCLMIGLSACWSNDFFHSLKYSLVYLETALIAIYFGKQYSWKEIHSFMRGMYLIILIISIYYANFVPSIGTDESGNWKGVMDHKNQYAFGMALTGVVWLIDGIYNPKQRKLAFGISILSLYAMNEAGSGASKVLFACLIFLMSSFNFIKNLPPKWAFVSVVIFFIISISLMIVVVDNLEYIVVDTLNKSMTITGRTLFWPIVIDLVNKKPVLGYGIGGFWQKWRSRDEDSSGYIVNPNGWIPPHSHNGFLDIATDLGWLGLSLYMLSFFNNLAKSVMYLTQDKMPEAGMPLILLTYLLMTNLTETGLLAVHNAWFWFVVITTRLSLDTNGSYKKNN